jgi:hypothetical protein
VEELKLALSKSEVPFLHTFILRAPGLSIPSLPTIFKDDVPNLHTLELEHFISWPVSLCANVVHLSLRDQPSFHRPSISRFLDLLEASPNLVHLQLENAGPQGEDRTSFNRVICLPKLKKLEMKEAYSHLILSHISLPADAFLSLASTCGHEQLFSIFPTNISHLSNLAKSEVLHISLGNSLSLTGTTRFPQWVSLRIGIIDRALLDLRLKCLQPLPKDQIKELWIEDYNDSAIVFSHGPAHVISYWLKFFSHFESLEKLVLSNSSIRLLDALSQPYLVSRTEDIVCHRLLSLHIFDYGGRSEIDSPVARFLRERKRCGHPIQNLILMYPGSVHQSSPSTSFEAENVELIEQMERPHFRFFERAFY